MTTPSEDSKPHVKLLLKAAQESWLNYGRPDRLTSETLKPLFLEHFLQMDNVEKELISMKDKFPSPEEFHLILQKLYQLQAELKEIQSKKYIDQQKIFSWGCRRAEINDYALAIKENRNPYYNPEKFKFDNYRQNFARISFFPMPYAEFDWRDLNDLWVAGIAIAGLSNQIFSVDGAAMKPLRFTLHDYNHASTLGLRMALLSPLRIARLVKEVRSYKKFRRLQSLETDPRKRAIREGIIFYLLHDSDLFPFSQPFDKVLVEFQHTIKNKFNKNDAEYGSSFKPEIHFTEFYTEIKWMLTTLKWDDQ